MGREKINCLVCRKIQRLLLTLLGGCLVAATGYAQPTSNLKVYPDQYVVEIQSIAGDGASNGNSNLGAVSAHDLGSGASLLNFSRIAGDGNNELEAVAYDANQDKCRELILHAQVKSCSPNYQVRASALPNDTQFGTLWGMSADRGIDAPGAWDVTTGSNSIVVAVIDTGADYTHPDLADNIWTNPGEIPGNGIDDDSDGYIDDVHGINAFSHNGNPMDDNGHGSHVSGTIGGTGNNNRGIAGVNWQVKIMPLKFLSSNGSGSLAGAIEAINYMVMMKNRGINIRVVNNSWGGGGFSQALYDAIKHARDAGIVFAAAAGNEGNDNDAQPSYPASYDLDNIVSVAAVDSNKNMASFSNYGASQVDIAAPGVSIISTVPGNMYQSFSGTSMATPHVAGAVALLAASEPNLSYHELINRMYDSGTTLAALSGIVRTGRMLNVSRMVHNQTAPIPAPAPVPAPCSYDMSAIGFDPDRSVDSQAIVLQADEFSYYTVSLPFIFPFHNQSISSLVLSPNGVAYTKSAPGSMDYENKSRVPLNSIAPLQTDLFASLDPNGIRVISDSNHLTVQWNAKHYDKKTGSDIQVWLTIYPDGRIRQFASFGGSAFADYVSKRATVGLNGSSSDAAFTYAYNNSLIKENMGVEFVPHCDNSARIARIRIKPSERQYRQAKSILPGKRIKVAIQGYGNGSVELQPAFDGQTCNEKISLIVSDGIAAFSSILSKGTERFSHFTLTSNGVRGAILIQGRNDARSRRERARRKRNRARAADVSRFCNAFAQSIRISAKKL